MKYLVLIYNNPATYESFSARQRAALFAEVDTVLRELTTTGELLGGETLADQSQSRTVRVRNGIPAVAQGPFAEAPEQLAGFLTVECESTERAVQIAASWPDAKYFAMEVRPVMHSTAPDL